MLCRLDVANWEIGRRLHLHAPSMLFHLSTVPPRASRERTSTPQKAALIVPWRRTRFENAKPMQTRTGLLAYFRNVLDSAADAPRPSIAIVHNRTSTYPSCSSRNTVAHGPPQPVALEPSGSPENPSYDPRSDEATHRGTHDLSNPRPPSQINRFASRRIRTANACMGWCLSLIHI